jgi:hypothetical protein
MLLRAKAHNYFEERGAPRFGFGDADAEAAVEEDILIIATGFIGRTKDELLNKAEERALVEVFGVFWIATPSAA